MLLQDFIPPQDVQEFVQLYRIVHLEFPKGQSIPPKAYPPRPEQCLAFYPFDTEIVTYASSNKVIQQIPVVLYGQFTQVTHRSIGQQFLVFQIVFKPGGLYRLTGIDAYALNNEYLDAEVHFSTEIRWVNEQLFHAGSYAEMIQVINRFLRQLMAKQRKPKLPVDDALSMLLTQSLNSVNGIAANSYLSTRQIERLCKQRSGVSPKLFERLIRFDKAFRLRNSFPNMHWLSIALECGYHDYHHLAKEYKSFTGLSPNAFHQIESNAPERKFGLIEKV